MPGEEPRVLCFAPRFHPYLLLFTTMLALTFWSLVTQLTTYDHVRVAVAGTGVPHRYVRVRRELV